jgi:hypothetical protein
MIDFHGRDIQTAQEANLRNQGPWANKTQGKDQEPVRIGPSKRALNVMQTCHADMQWTTSDDVFFFAYEWIKELSS